jgi:ATP-dependent DNA helicase RecG
MNSEDIDELLHKQESERLEFKSADASVRTIAAAVCSLLNAKGGTVVVGVRDGGEVEPVPDVEQQVRKIEAFLRENLSPPSLWSASRETVSQGRIIVIDVPAGSERPYVCDGSIYVRKGAQTLPADAETIRRLVAQQYRAPVQWERQPSADLAFADLDEREICRTAEDGRQKRNYAFQNADDATEVLKDLGLVQSGIPTNGADVLFGKKPSSRLPQTRIRGTVYATNKGGDFVDDRLFEGNAMALLEQVFSFVEQHVRVESRFKAGKIIREDRPEYPFAALREGLINAIVHRDYSVSTGGMAVGVYPDRIEIWNTGRLPEGWKPRDLRKEHVSQPANPRMAHVFYLRGIIERVGRGTLKILDECATAGLRPPNWRETPGGITLVLYGERRRAHLNSRQRRLLERLRPGDELRPGDYYAELEGEVSQRQAQRDLSHLESAGWLRKEGEGPSTVYIRSEQKAP